MRKRNLLISMLVLPLVLKVKNALAGVQMYDVIVIGGGGAGLAAAISAKQSGAKKVCILEKEPILGGHTLASSGSINAFDPKRGNKKDSVNNFIDETLKAGEYKANPKLVETLAKGSEKLILWLESFGIKFSDELYEAYSGASARAHKTEFSKSSHEYVQALSRAASKLGVDIFLETKAKALIFYDGEVIGVTTQNQKFLGKSTVIATGGFSGSVKLRTKYREELGSEYSSSYTSVTGAADPAQGEGIIMANALGAKLVGMQDILIIPIAGGRLLDYPGADIFLTRNGRRFTDERGTWITIFKDFVKTKSEGFWVLTDSKSLKSSDFVSKVESGKVKVADSLEEVAKGMKVRLATLKEELTSYNELADMNVADFKAKRQKIDTPPFYYGLEHFDVHYTMGGIAINTLAQVLDENDEPIVGLYAAGETTGGIHGTFRLGGNGLTDAFVFGRIAGKSAAEFARNKKAFLNP